MTATSAIIKLHKPLAVPNVAEGTTTSTAKTAYSTIICNPRPATGAAEKKLGIRLIEILAVDSNADTLSNYTFCVQPEDIYLLVFADAGDNLDTVAELIDDNGSGWIDVRPFDTGYSDGANDYPEVPMLEQLSPAATTETDLYTVPDFKTARITSIFIANRGAATSFRLSISKAGAATSNKDYTHYDISIGANSSLNVDIPTDGFALSAGDVVRAYAGAATLSFTVSGREFNK